MEKLTDNKYKNVMCVYRIVNSGNGKAYVGSTKDLRNRINAHINQLNNIDHGNSELQKEWNIYGSEKFSFEVVKLIEDEQELPEVEKYYIDIHKEINGVYNKSDPTKEFIRGSRKKLDKGRNKKGIKYKLSQDYILNYLDDNFEELIHAMHNNIEEKIFFEKEKIDKWIIDKIDSQDVLSDDRTKGLVNRWYNENGFSLLQAEMYETELRVLYKKESSSEYIITNRQISRELYEARKMKLKGKRIEKIEIKTLKKDNRKRKKRIEKKKSKPEKSYITLVKKEMDKQFQFLFEKMIDELNKRTAIPLVNILNYIIENIEIEKDINRQTYNEALQKLLREKGLSILDFENEKSYIRSVLDENGVKKYEKSILNKENSKKILQEIKEIRLLSQESNK